MSLQAAPDWLPDLNLEVTQPRPESHDSTSHQDPEEAQASDGDEAPAEMSAPKKKKRKAKGKSLASRGPTALPKNRGSGFEEYFADPPMTPLEAMEEKNEIYSEEFPFEVRMQSCIQRFRSRRRLQGQHTLYFNEYLFLGGVDTNPGAFGGLDPKELKQLTPAQRREATARDVVYGGSAAGDRFYNGDEESWSVDFAGVAAGFFSTALVQQTGLEAGPMSTGIGVVENFLRYVLHHDVCPEYAEDVNRALEICNQAREEWPMLGRLQSELPGLFNLAATELFSKPSADDWAFQSFKRPDGFDAKPAFYAAFALMDDPEAFDHLLKGAVELVDEYDCTLQIIKIDQACEDVALRFKNMVIDTADGAKLRLAPMGRVTLKPAVIKDEWVHPTVPSPIRDEQVTLYFEDTILNNMKPGMKMMVRIGELGGGIRFLKTVRAIVPTFYTFLPQEMMKHYKAPRDNDRPAPSIHDSEAREDQMADD